jgi:hypothetical protein
VSDWPLAARLLISRVGRGALALALLALTSGVIWLSWLPAAQDRLARETRRLLSPGGPAALSPQVPAGPMGTDALALFEQRLATEDDRDRLMKQIWEHGPAAGLQLSQVDYRTAAGAGGRFRRLSIRLPMTGSYPAVRGFLFGLMATCPGLSLDQLDIKRDHAATAEIAADAHLTLYLRP